MKPVFQDKFYDPRVPTKGNCTQAAIASILEKELDEVPNFVEEEYFWTSIKDYLYARGFKLTEHHKDHVPDGYYLVSGLSPRDVLHMVIYLDGELAHDPHPSGAGILGPDRIFSLDPHD